MIHRSRICNAAIAMILGQFPAIAQALAQNSAAHTYECTANAHCNISCLVDGEKLIQTGAPKMVTVTLIAPNNYLVEVVEQDGRAQFVYMAGARVVCSLEGLTGKGQ